MGLGIKTKVYALYDWVFKDRMPTLRRLLGDTSEHGELFLLVRLAKGSPNRFLVDVGANDGITASNSYGLILRGWEGILVEPYPPCFQQLQQRYGNSPKVRLVNSACGCEFGELDLFLGKDGTAAGYATLCTDDSDWFRATRTGESVKVPVSPLTAILEKNGCPPRFAVLSVDTEGYDLRVLESLDFNRFRPEVIITEDDPILLPPPTDLKTDERKYALLKREGYELAKHYSRNSVWKLAR